MGYFAGMTAGLYRHTMDGRRIYQLVSPAPRRRWPTYLVSDPDALRIEARLRQVLVLVYCVFIPLMGISTVVFSLGVFSRPSMWEVIALVTLVPASLMYGMLRLWVLRGIPRVVLGGSDLEPFDRRAREMLQWQAMGTRTLIALILAAMLMAAGQIAVLVVDGDWWAWLGTLLFGGSTVFLVRSFILLRRAQRGRSRDAS